MPSNLPHVAAAMSRYPWAMMPDQLAALVEIVERRADGIRLTPGDLQGFAADRTVNGALSLLAVDTLAPVSARGEGGGVQGSVIAVISIYGVIAQRISMIDDLCGPGGTSTERVTNSFRAALADQSVTAIVFNFDSPGGNVYGVQALADEIFKARGEKPIVAQIDSLAASAAYWIASACDEIVITPGGEAGSIGVYALHADVSEAAKMQGVKYTFISAGKFKVEGNQFEPLSEEASGAFQVLIDDYYRDFTASVARGRGVKASEVVNGFGEGRVVKDKQAVSLGMADRVAPLDDTLRRLSKKRVPKASAAQMAAASAVTLRSDNGTTSVEGEWPPQMLVSKELIAAPPDGVLIEEAAGVLSIVVANGSAVYQLEALSDTGDWLCSLTSSTLDAAITAEAGAAAAAADAHRRRRHAHRLRGA